MSIQNRTLYYDDTGGVYRWWDWAKVTTTLGTMVEPHAGLSRHERDTAFEAFDPEDEIARVDAIRVYSADKQQLVLSGGEYHLIGGYQLPRTGK